MPERRRASRRAALSIACFAVFIAASLFMLRRVDRTPIEYDAAARQREADALSEVVDVGGVACVPKRNVDTFLFMGIDDTAMRGENYVTGGQADMLMLLAVDRTHGTYRRLPINRNTMCAVRSYDIDGEDLGTVECQIALAHSSGDGGTLSCENAVEAVSTYLHGVKIDNYLALGIEAIPVVNHLAGGVTVTVEDDFSRVDPGLQAGRTVTLDDAQAVEFVRNRMDVGRGTNEERMRRQDAYFGSMLGRVMEKSMENAAFALEFYDAMGPYMVTDMNGKAFSRLIRALTDCEEQAAVSIAGTVGVDEFGFATFEPDAASVRDAVISLFYDPADGENT